MPNLIWLELNWVANKFFKFSYQCLFLNSVTRLISEVIKFFSVPDWRKPGVKFGWAMKSSNNRFYPGFLLNKEFRWITTKSELSSYSFKPVQFCEELKKRHKNKAHMEHLRKFNRQNETSFAWESFSFHLNKNFI